MDAEAWLKSLSLRHEQAARRTAIDACEPPKLTADNLQEQGSTLAGHYFKLLEAAPGSASPRSTDDPNCTAIKSPAIRHAIPDLAASSSHAIVLDIGLPGLGHRRSCTSHASQQGPGQGL